MLCDCKSCYVPRPGLEHADKRFLRLDENYRTWRYWLWLKPVPDILSCPHCRHTAHIDWWEEQSMQEALRAEAA
jgi:hypothetical protein